MNNLKWYQFYIKALVFEYVTSCRKKFSFWGNLHFGKNNSASKLETSRIIYLAIHRLSCFSSSSSCFSARCVKFHWNWSSRPEFYFQTYRSYVIETNNMPQATGVCLKSLNAHQRIVVTLSPKYCQYWTTQNTLIRAFSGKLCFYL